MDVNIIDKVIERLIDSVPEEDRNNRPKMARIARMTARITCRELAAVLGLTIGQVSDVEFGRREVSANIIAAWFMVCGSKLVVQKEMNDGPP
jgi:transcriptional regulator with XRE-family HTH domain